MKTLFRNTLVKPGAVLALAMAAILSGGAAHAAGTASGVSIDNKATLNYKVGNTSQSAIISSPDGLTPTGVNTSFQVDNKVNLLVTTVNQAFKEVVPNLTIAAATATHVAVFNLKNTGNTAQGFLLTTANLANGATLYTGTDNINDVGASACTIKVDSGAAANPAAPTGYSASLASATSIASLSPDFEQIIYVVCPFASTVADGNVAVISLTAQATTANTTTAVGNSTVVNDNLAVEIVLADIAGSDDGLKDGRSSSRDAFQVKSAKLTVTKTVAPVCDPFNGPTNAKNIPGSYVSYTITIANSGTTSAILGIVGDPLTTTLTFDPDFIVGATAAACNAVGALPTPGVATSGSGNVKIVARGATSFKTSAGDTDGVSLAVVSSVPTLSVDFGTVLPVVGSTYTAGELKPTETVTVTFQAKIN